MGLCRINGLLETINCPHCQCDEALRINSGDNKGFALQLKLVCNSCHFEFGSTHSSPVLDTGVTPQPFAINDIMVLLFNHLGLGHTAMREFCGVLGIPAMHLKTFQKKEKRIIGKTVEATNIVLQQSADVVRAMHSATNPGDVDDSPMCITVSFDGTWQKRGHMSMHGVAAVIDIMTGLVVDYEVLSMYCHSCSLKKAQLGADTAVFAEWYAVHRDDCSVNYHGSSNAMEVEAAKRLWTRSVHTRGLMYTGMLGDGDSKAYQAVVDLEPYGPDVTIEREECVNHAHKCMGTALLKLSKQERLGGRGPGRLTKQTALKLQQYYRGAIMGGGDEDSMRSRVWATLFHCMSTDDDPHHTRCPQSWCFYQQALAEDQEPPPHEGNIKYPLAYDVAEAMVPVYKRMSDPNLLKRLAKGKTVMSPCTPSSGADARRRCLLGEPSCMVLLRERSAASMLVRVSSPT